MYDLTQSFSTADSRFRFADEAENGTAGGYQPGPALLSRMLDVVDYGLLLVDEDAQVAFANQVARSELNQRHPLQLHGQLLRVRHPEDLAPMRLALLSATQKGLQRLLTIGETGDDAITLSIIPMHDGDQAKPAAMIAFGKRKVCEDLSAEAFARHFRLTSAEIRVLKQLCAGHSPADIARTQGVAVCTIRTQIGCMREKTRSDSIGALVRKVARLPPMLSILRTAA